MNYEKLSPNLTLEMLEKRLIELKLLLEKAKRSVKTRPQGHLRISQKGNSIEYYHITSSDEPLGKYIPLSQENLARQLAQKDYEKKALKLIEEEIKAIQHYLKLVGHNKNDNRKSTVASSNRTLNSNKTSEANISSNSNSTSLSKLAELYTKMNPARQALITPFTLTDAQYAEQWQSVTWTGHPFSEETPVYTTALGERVRSKSEVLIADALSRHNIPYRYEYPLQVHKKRFNARNHNYTGQNQNISNKSVQSFTLYPDFLCLNLQTRTEFYWEHFGLIDKADYATNAAGKLRLYAENGILPGRNLIITMESQEEPLSSQTIDQMIKAYLKSSL